MSSKSSKHFGLILISTGCLFLFHFIDIFTEGVPFVESSWFSLILAVLFIITTVLMLGFFAKMITKKGAYNYQLPSSFNVRFNRKIPGKHFAYFLVFSLAVLGADYGLYVLTEKPESVFPFLISAGGVIYGLAFIFGLVELGKPVSKD